MTEPLHVAYRPSKQLALAFEVDEDGKQLESGLDLVLGQDETIKSLKAQLAKENKPHAYLFIGPPGTGKTTLARILAEEIGCTGAGGLLEIDAPSQGGVENIRKYTEEMEYLPMGGGNKMLLIDECHALSKEGFSALLKSIEEPPAHAYYVLATTDPGKISKAIRTRCVEYNLNLVPKNLIIKRMHFISQIEGLNTPLEIIDMCASSANGCVRQALVYLAKVSGCDIEEARSLLSAFDAENEKTPFSQIAQLLMRREKSWQVYKPYVAQLTSSDKTGIRHRLSAYLAAVLSNSDDNQFNRLMPLVDYVDQLPTNPSEAEGLFALQLLIGKLAL